jgi:hypothetical protein
MFPRSKSEIQRSPPSFLNELLFDKRKSSPTSSPSSESSSPSSPNNHHHHHHQMESEMNTNEDNIKQMEEEERCKGYVQLLSTAQIRPWVKRYLYLSRDTLYIFKTHKDKKPILSIATGAIYRIERIEKWHKKREYCFCVKSYGRTLIISVENLDILGEWISGLEQSIKDCAIDGLSGAFTHLLNAMQGDEIRFGTELLKVMQNTVHQWSNNVNTFSTDVRRITQYMIKETNEKRNEDDKKLELEENTKAWQIDYKNVTLGKKIAEGFFGEV